VRTLARPVRKTPHVTVNLLGSTALGFRHRDDILEVTALLADLGVGVNVVAPMTASPADIARLGAAHFNVVLYPETAESAARWMEREFQMPYTKVVPIGVGATHDFVKEVVTLTGGKPSLDVSRLHLPWYSRSVDSNYLTGKRVFVFGDGTHAMAAARIARDEMGFDVVGLGCYNRERARAVRSMARDLGCDVLITDDYLEVERSIESLAPELILGTQMERHIGKRLGIPCAVISAPVHVQDFPARYSPQMGIEGANVIFDTWVHPLVMGLEEHLLTMFREDFEFCDEAGPSHHGVVSASRSESCAEPGVESMRPSTIEIVWRPAAEKELRKIPFFVRGKARRNTEIFAGERGLSEIDIDTLYEAKAHYAR